jgi:hypothetical protein
VDVEGLTGDLVVDEVVVHSQPSHKRFPMDAACSGGCCWVT